MTSLRHLRETLVSTSPVISMCGNTRKYFMEAFGQQVKVSRSCLGTMALYLGSSFKRLMCRGSAVRNAPGRYTANSPPFWFEMRIHTESEQCILAILLCCDPGQVINNSLFVYRTRARPIFAPAASWRSQCACSRTTGIAIASGAAGALPAEKRLQRSA